MKAKVIIFLNLLIFAGLTGCSPDLGTNNEEISTGETGFITDLANDKEVLIKNTYYTISENTSIKDSNGDKLKVKDLQIGMKAKVWYAGGIEESFPGRASARLIMIQKDSESLKEEKVVKAAISYVQEGESQRFFVRKITYLADEGAYQLEMMSRSNLDSSFSVTVDEYSYKIIYQE